MIKFKTKQIILTITLLSVIFLLAPSVQASSVTCEDDGSITILKSTKKSRVKAKQKGSKDPYIEVPGSWQTVGEGKKKYYNFISEEAQFIVGKPTKFYLKIGSKSRKSVTCPVFKFACKALNSTVESCYKRNNTFFAKFYINNIALRDKKHTFRFGNPFSLKYAIHTPGGNQLTHSPDAYSPEFKDINMTLKKLRGRNKYSLNTIDVPQKAEKFSLSYECKNSVFYSSGFCTDMPSCKYDGDCLNDEFCRDEICEKVDCGECQYPEDHKCLSYGCCLNIDCSEDEFCEDKECIKLDCNEEESIIDHSCSLLTCESDEHTVDHKCVKIQCEEYEYAVDHQCELLQCAYNEKIEDHKCKKLECKFYQREFDHDCLGIVSYIFAERSD